MVSIPQAAQLHRECLFRSPRIARIEGHRFAGEGYLHIVDTVALVHALVLRLQAVVLPLKALVFGGR
jgi:hypothetical protein